MSETWQFPRKTKWHILSKEEVCALIAFKEALEDERWQPDCIWPEEIPHATSTTAALASESDVQFKYGTERQFRNLRSAYESGNPLWAGHQYRLRVQRSRAAAAAAKRLEREARKQKRKAFDMCLVEVDGSQSVGP